MLISHPMMYVNRIKLTMTRNSIQILTSVVRFGLSYSPSVTRRPVNHNEYHYYDYIASDQPLSKIWWDNDNLLFDDDIDDELSKILNNNYSENSEKRPDIALFHGEGSAVIVEFKAPGVSVDAYIGDLMEYAQLLAAKSK